MKIGKRTVSITARNLEGMVRLAEAVAKMGLKNKVERKHAKEAVELLHNCLNQIAKDPETGLLDADVINTGISSSKRGKILNIKQIINDLESKSEDKTVKIADLIKEAAESGMDKDSCEEVIENLKRSGDIYGPKSGIIKKL